VPNPVPDVTDVFDLELLVDRVRDRRLGRRREDRDEPDERDSEHQRGRGGRGALRVPSRVLARECPRHALDRAQWCAEPAREPAREQRREDDGAGEHEHRTRADIDEPAGDIREHADEQERETEPEHEQPGDRARDHLGRTLERDIAQRRDRWDVRRLPRGEDRGKHRDDAADDETDDDGARLHDDPAARDVDADQREQAFEQSGHEDAAEDAEAGREEPDHQGLAQHGQQYLPAARADRAQQRQLTRPLGDDDREGVVDDEDRDDERDEREDREAELEETELLPDEILTLLGDLLAGEHFVVAERERLLQPRFQRLLRQPGLTDDGDAVELPGVRAFCACAGVKSTTDAPRAVGGARRDAHDLVRLRWVDRETSTLSPTCKFPLRNACR
jgi:hypothetical protein